ncbi:MAG TPA: DinB family protein [Longimicrobiales bacterium]|nr:DinB family protein [Longimicrobiales bacterium]
MSLLRSSLAATALMLLASAPVAAQQQQPALVVDLVEDIGRVKGKTTALSEAMPEDTYAWRPMEGVRSVAEVYKHVISDNYLLAAAAGHPAPESTGIVGTDYRTAVAYEQRSMSKAEIVEALRVSFDHLEKAVGATTRENLNADYSVFGMDMTGRGLWILTVTHLHEHLGQSIAYARSNGVVPPWSR